MNMKLLFQLGEMILRSKESGEWVDPDDAKPQVIKYIEDIAAGRTGEDLTREENDAWGEMGRRLHGTDGYPSTLRTSSDLIESRPSLTCISPLASGRESVKPVS